MSFSPTSAPVVFEGITFVSYTEELREASICGGSAVYISFTVVFCSDKPRKAYNLYVTYRGAAIGAVAAQLGALEFDGSCPLGGKCLELCCFPRPI